MAHLPQLTAHSQVVPGEGQQQLHYIPLQTVASLSSTTFQPGSRPLPFQHQILRSTSIVHDGPPPVGGLGSRVIGGCIICFGPLPPRIARGVCNASELFSSCCRLLEVPFNELQHEWDFDNGDKLPFCMTCTRAIQMLLSFQNQLELIKKKIVDGIENIRSKVQHSESLVHGADMRTAKFRSRVLGTQFLCMPGATSSHQTSSHLRSGSDDGSRSPYADDVSEFSYMLNPLSSAAQNPETEIEVCSESSHSGSHSQLMSPSQTVSFLSYGETTETVRQLLVNSFPSSVKTPSANRLVGISNTVERPNNENSLGGSTITSTRSLIETDNDEDKPKTDNAKLARNPKKTAKKDGKLQSKENENTSVSSRRRSKASTNAPEKITNKRQNLEHFSPIQTNDEGQMTYEGFEITPTQLGYICGSCGALCGKGDDTASMRKIKIHIKGVHLGAYKCPICSKYFSSNDILLQHTARGHNQDDVPCDICKRPVRPRYLNNHRFTHMSSVEKEAFMSETGFKPLTYQSAEPTCMCKTCGKMFKKHSALRRHEASHLDIESRKDHKCTLCEKSYTSVQALKEHQILHHDAIGTARRSSSMCKHCGKIMFSKYLQKHLLSHIPKEDRPLVCKICGRRFVDKKTLQRHEKSHDLSEKPETYKFECDVCGKRFVTFKKMRTHRGRTHQNHWKIAVPSKLINEVSVDNPSGEVLPEDTDNEHKEQLQELGAQLYSYQLYRIEKIGEPPPGGYRCSTCSKTFLGENDLIENDIKSHIRSEHIGNFKCNLCSKRMKNIDEVLAHKRSEHMKKVSFSCDMCKKPGIPAKTIRSHTWTHKNLNDMGDSINSGESIPNNFDKMLLAIQKQQTLLTGFSFETDFQCGICQITHDSVQNLYKHRVEAHPASLQTKSHTSLKGGTKRKLATKINDGEGKIGSRKIAKSVIYKEKVKGTSQALSTSFDSSDENDGCSIHGVEPADNEIAIGDLIPGGNDKVKGVVMGKLRNREKLRRVNSSTYGESDGDSEFS